MGKGKPDSQETSTAKNRRKAKEARAKKEGEDMHSGGMKSEEARWCKMKTLVFSSDKKPLKSFQMRWIFLKNTHLTLLCMYARDRWNFASWD